MSLRVTLATLIPASFLASFGLTVLVRRYALRSGVMDHPNERSSHSVPTPRGGGVAILTSFLIAILAAALLRHAAWGDVATIGLGSVALGALGWLDDHRNLRAGIRFLVQLSVAAWAVQRFGGLPAVRIGEFVIPLGASGYLLGTFGLVWCINLFNFMDGIDGLATSQAMLILATIGLLLFASANVSLAVIALLAASAAAGFLPWNWPRARIFLGDVGSGAIGFLIGALAIASENRGGVPVLVVAIIGGVFLADSTVTLVRRLLRGERPWEAHRTHAYQRLSRAFESHRAVTVAAILETLILALAGAAAALNPTLFLPAALVAAALLAATLVYAERRAPT